MNQSLAFGPRQSSQGHFTGLMMVPILADFELAEPEALRGPALGLSSSIQVPFHNNSFVSKGHSP